MFLKRVQNKIRRLTGGDTLISLDPNEIVIGRVLLSYLTQPFLQEKNCSGCNTHTNVWECAQIAKTFLGFGYGVDIIDYTNGSFIPRQSYKFFIDIHNNLERLAPFLNHDCAKILHITGAHWLFQNYAEYLRLVALKQRKGITLYPKRTVSPSLGIEHCSYATILGNQFTISTFEYARKPIYRIPISTTNIYPWLKEKDYDACRKNFLWFGGTGLVHKGLDLVLEAFTEMPDYSLTVCGPISAEKDFENAFYNELYHTPNIHTIGWVDTNSPEFIRVLKHSIGLIYPSCSEGGGGSVITCLHGGLIPIISYESSVDVNDFGIILHTSSIDEIKDSIRKIGSLPVNELERRSRCAFRFARENHTKERFAKAYEQFVLDILREENVY